MAKILLVDDSEPNRAMLARRLSRKGHIVIEAADGRQAVNMTRTELPDLVLMDLNLPVLDGWSATREIKAFPGTPPVPVIALTAHAMSGDRQKAMQAGCDDYDTKPIDFSRLLRKIEALYKSVGTRPNTAIEQPLPAPVRDPSTSEDESDDREVDATPAGRVLVVDDTEANRHLATRWLRRKGFVVDAAEDGDHAIQMIQKADYDVVLLDIMMPGINGISVLRTLRESRSPTQLPVIMATAKDASDDVVEALALGANDYVTKPLDFPILIARVGTQVSLKRSVEQRDRLEHGLEQRNRELNAANRRMQADLVAAAKIQAALLPTDGPRVEGYDFAWLFEPSAGLAGDILNVFSLNDRQVGAYVLDVSGHGVAAALLSVTVSRFLSPNPDPSSMLWRRAQDRPDAAGSSPSQHAFELETPPRVAERLSRRFPFDDVTGQYFTMVYGVLDIQLHELRYTSAGHPNLLLVTARGDARSLAASGYPIGVGPAEDYEEECFALAPGDRLYIHSDGLNEAMSPSGELFGVARMIEVLRTARSKSLNDSLQRLSGAIRQWTRSSDRLDDQTVLAMERLAD